MCSVLLLCYNFITGSQFKTFFNTKKTSSVSDVNIYLLSWTLFICNIQFISTYFVKDHVRHLLALVLAR